MNENERPGGWVNGIGWVSRACDLSVGDWMCLPGLPEPVQHQGMPCKDTNPILVTRWADGSAPSAPVAPEPDGELRRLAKAVLATHQRYVSEEGRVSDFCNFCDQGNANTDSSSLYTEPAWPCETVRLARLAAGVPSTPQTPDDPCPCQDRPDEWGSDGWWVRCALIDFMEEAEASAADVRPVDGEEFQIEADQHERRAAAARRILVAMGEDLVNANGVAAPSTSDEEAPSGKPLQAWPHTVHHPGCACLPDVVQPPAAAVPVVPEEPAGDPKPWKVVGADCETGFASEDEADAYVILHSYCTDGSPHWVRPPAPVADVEPQPDAPTARAVSEALHNAGVNTTVSASDNGLLIRVSNRYTPRLLDVLDPASAPDVLRMPADVAAAFDALAAAIDSDDKISTIDYLAGRFASKAVRVAGAAVDFMDAARSASGSTKA